MSKPLLCADSVGRRFGRRQILKAATLQAFAGRCTVLLGRNGCGKSTLLRISAGLLRPDFGTVRFGGRVYTRPRLPVLARAGLFFIPERGLLSPYLTLAQHLALARPAPAVLATVTEKLGLAQLTGHLGRQLSPGERRRADIALALLRAPLCLFADEPFQGIAPLDCERIISALRDMKDQGVALVLTGHELGPLFEIADEVVWLTAGTTHLVGSVHDARANFAFASEYLGAGQRLPGC